MGTAYRVLIGSNFPDGSGAERRIEPDTEVSDLPEKVAKNLLAVGAIELAASKPTLHQDGED